MGDSLQTLNNFRKSLTAPKKIERGPFSLIRFVRLRLKREKIKGGPFALSFRWPDLALVVLVLSVKCGLFSVRSVVWRKNKGYCKSRAIFAKQKAPTKNMNRKKRVKCVSQRIA